MPLLKLWNSLIGRPASDKPSSKPTPEQTAVKPTPHPPETVGTELTPARAKKTAKAATSTSAIPVRLAPLATAELEVASAPKRQFKVVTRGEHAELCRLAIETRATSILEIGVGDGARAEALMQSLQSISSDKAYRYAAIDQFEMVGGPVTLKDFHHRMRGIEIRPQVFPEPIPQGLAKFSRTVGFADLVISSIPEDQWSSLEVQSLIARVTKKSSVVLRQAGGRWQKTIREDAGQVVTRKVA